ncbi:unnamed protein product [Ascophyllum nodosum]
MVSSGVVLEADVRVPQGTVGVTRGGELKGRVVAKEFLLEDGGRLDGDVECDFAVIEGYLKGSLVSREVSTIGPSALFDGDVIYNVLELDKGAVITGRLFSIRSTASNVLQDQDRPVTDANIIKQRRLQHELRQRQRVGQRGLDAPAPSSRLDYDYDDDDRSKENPSLTGVDRRIVAAGSSKPSPVKTLMTSSMTSSMASLLMSGERRAFSGSDISGGSNKNASARRGEDDISGISGAAKGGFGALSGLWGTMLEGMAWARALSDAPAAAAAATSAATNNSTASAHQLEEEHPRHRSGDHSGERFQQSSIRDAKIKQVWIRAAERRAQIA